MSANLSEFNLILVGDASGSMTSGDCPRGLTRWAYMAETFQSFAREISAIDSDGIDVILFSGSRITTLPGATETGIAEAMANRRPSGSTPLAEALASAFALAGKSDKPAFITVFTDGVPDDQEAVARVIREQANTQETDDECTVLFIQVGHDSAATAYLKSLDDNLKGAKFDIVDTVTIEESEKFTTISALVEKAIND